MYLRRELKISSIIHLGILLCLIISPIIFPARYRYNRSTVHTVQLISMPAIRPQQTPAKVSKTTAPVKEAKKPGPKKETKKLEPKPKAMTIPKKITTPTLEEKLSKRLESIDKEEFVEPESETSITPQLNIGVSSPSNFPFQFYLGWIHDKISASWHEPQMVLDKRYTAIVTFTILQDGSVQNIYVKKGSGVSNFDQSGLRAVESARPFPPLPQGYSHPQLTVNVAFNLE